MKETNILKQFVRGEVNYKALEKLGLQVKKNEDKNISIEQENFEHVYDVKLEDLIEGLNSLKSTPGQLEIWATILIGSDLFDFDYLNTQDYGDHIIEKLWDISTNGEIDEKSLKIIMSYMKK